MKMRNITRSDSTAIGVVLSGGGTRSAYAVGALRALAEEHGVKSPHVLGALSGGVAPGLLSLTGRFDEMYAWAERCDNPRFISWRRVGSSIMDVNFWVDNIVSTQAPSLPKEIESASTKIFIAATVLPTGRPHWFSNADAKNLFDIMRAAITVPGISGNGVKINSRIYVDGCLSISLEDAVEKAFAEGAEKVILIDNSTSYGQASLQTAALMRLKTRNAPSHIRALVERYVAGSTRPQKLEAHQNLIVCRGERLAIQHTFDRNSRRVRRTMEQGYADMARLTLT